MSNETAPPPSVELGATIGALEISILVAVYLSGILTIQVWLYFQRYWGDARVQKLLVSKSTGEYQYLVQSELGGAQLDLGPRAYSGDLPHSLHYHGDPVRPASTAHYPTIIFGYCDFNERIYWPARTGAVSAFFTESTSLTRCS